ncbi:MAG: sugar-binding domain-containing protein [Pseudorhodobacter sp.]|nr:sugar-binding domain-containing protein [Pseudorhodobacter sp.]
MTQDALPSLQDEAARAGWLSYVGGLTQDQIAAELGVSRQRAQRLVSKALAEGLIHVRLEHKIAACLQLEADLIRRFGLGPCRVAPGLGAGVDPARACAGPAAALLEGYLARPEPQVIALGTGRALRAMVDELTAQSCERHRIVSLIGNIAPDGSASFYDVIMRVADKLHTPHYPMPVPVISDSAAERALFHSLRPVRAVTQLALAADVTFVGVGQMSDDAPLLKDKFVTPGQLAEMQGVGAAGEIAGWIFDASGHYIDCAANQCVGGVRIEAARPLPVIGVAAGATKVPAIRAALIGRLINGLVTDEPTARALLTL